MNHVKQGSKRLNTDFSTSQEIMIASKLLTILFFFLRGSDGISQLSLIFAALLSTWTCIYPKWENWLEGRPLYGLCRPLQDTKKPTPSLPFSHVSTINCFYFYVSTPTLLYAELVAESTCITPPFLLTDYTDDDFTTLRWRQKWCGMKRSLLRDWHWKCCFSFVCFAKRLLHCNHMFNSATDM